MDSLREFLKYYMKEKFKGVPISINTCFKCGVVYDTDFQMEMIDDEMVCDSCYEEWTEESRTDLTPSEKAISNTSFLDRMSDSAFEDMIGNE